MNAPDFLNRLRQKNAEKYAPSPNCINPVKDFMQFVQFAPSAKKIDFSETAPLTAIKETAIRAWLALIEETDPATIAEVIGQCQRDAEARDYFTGRAAAELPKPDPFPDDRRTCSQCQNLRGRVCSIARPGGLVSANRGYRPAPDALQRCAGYAPGWADTDRRQAWERWPGLAREGESK